MTDTHHDGPVTYTQLRSTTALSPMCSTTALSPMCSTTAMAPNDGPMTDADLTAAIAARGPEWAKTVETRREKERERDRRRRQDPEYREKKRESDARRRQDPEYREKKRESKARRRQDPDYRARERDSDARRRQDPEYQEKKRKWQKRRPPRPILAVDGEGAGVDAHGRQNYALMKAANANLKFTLRRDSGGALSTIECLEFILSLPKRPTLVGYGFSYDSNQIMRGILASTPKTMEKILKPWQGKNGPGPTFWGEYAITCVPGQFFRVARIDRTGPKPRVLKGSSRTIYDVIGLFRAPFVRAIESWNVGTPKERAVIEKNKSLRDDFSELTEEIERYCTLECRLLAQMMEKLRAACYAAGIRPARWSTVGWLAAALLIDHTIPKRRETKRDLENKAGLKEAKTPRLVARRPERPLHLEQAAARASAGGRAEARGIGYFPGPIYQYDKRSAYMSTLPQLPCPWHTGWEHRTYIRSLPKDRLYVALVAFRSPPDAPYGGLPFRNNLGLYWPLEGTGWYWSFEIEAAQRLGVEIVLIHDAWVAVPRRGCRCRTWDWVHDVYERRQALDRESPGAGTPLKLAGAALWGKLAQRAGTAPWHDTIDAGLVCAITRASLNDAIALDPGAVLMVATDAVYTTRPLPLDIGEGLGQWNETVLPDLFIVKPGVYWSPSNLEASLKTRGTEQSIIGAAAPDFERVFREWLPQLRDPVQRDAFLKHRGSIPRVPVMVRFFWSIRYAMQIEKPWLAGKWEKKRQKESFEWRSKRDAQHIIVGETNILTRPWRGELLKESAGYNPVDFDEPPEELSNMMDLLMEAMPDHCIFLPHE